MSDNLNDDQLDFCRNQMNPNQNGRANIFLRQDRREISFIVDKNFLETSFNKFLYDNFQRFGQIVQSNQSIAQLTIYIKL